MDGSGLADLIRTERMLAVVEAAVYGFTTVTYRCGCRLQTTRTHRGKVAAVGLPTRQAYS
jgi:hypothetical protein